MKNAGVLNPFRSILRFGSHAKRMAVFGAIFAIIGVYALLSSRAAVSIVVDTSLPVPQNVKAYGDDRNIIATWDYVSNNRVVGYYITYRPKGSSEPFKVRQTEYNAIQLQPLTNGVEYEIYVQSASGTYKSASAGPLVYSGNQNVWAVADGKVSNKSALITAAPSSARVDQMRSRLTSFFDDFNTVAGPMDELKWNHATTACARAGSAAAFINDQFHSHNTVGSAAPGEAFCDRAGIASRPRGVFDISTATESNPARIEFDIDGASHPRDTWYLDIVPLSARTNNFPLDITSHNDLFDTDTQNPGNMLRINARKDVLNFAYYDQNQSPSQMNLFTESTACSQSWRGSTTVDYSTCTMTQKTSGISPLPQNTLSAAPIPNVRRHWVVTVTPTKIRLYIDGTFMASANLPANMAAAKKFTLHSTVFSYNTGKIDGSTQDGQPVPSIEMLHWDNFGFSGPAQQEIIYNYLEGGASGTNPAYASGDSNGYRIPSGSRKTIIPIPDDIGNLVNGQARLYYTIGGFNYDTSNWTSGDHILVNGKRYDVPNPSTQMSKVSNPLAMNNLVTSFTLPINKADLIKGNNSIEFKFASSGASFINVHIELPYSSSDTSRPQYTQPITVFGAKFYNISQPPIMNCDQYRYVEQDLGLPYQTGKANIPTGGACELLPKGSHHNTTGTTDTTPPPPPPADTTPPTVTITSPQTAQTITSNQSFDVAVNASDSVGVTLVEFLVDGQVKYSDSSSPYSITIRGTDAAVGAHQLTVKAYDAAGNSATGTGSLQFTIQAPPTANRFETLSVGSTLPTEAECASRVRSVSEIPSRATINASYNARKGSGGNYYNARVTGNYAGTTDEILQWASCKWGIDEDVLRAQAVKESYWYQNAIGDFTTNGTLCSPLLPIATYPSQYSGDSIHISQCPESVGLLQVRWTYHKSAFYSSATENNSTLTNNAVYSTAYNVDYYGSVWRSCYEGNEAWLNSYEKGATYTSGDMWGCLGVWFSGRWKTAPALQYISDVQTILANRVWESQGFANATSPNSIIQPAQPNTSDTIGPSLSVSQPVANQQIVGTATVSVDANDPSGVASVMMYLDNSTTPLFTDTQAPYAFSWNSSSVNNGTHSILIRATDTKGNVSQSQSIPVLVNNIVADTVAPTGSITQPQQQSTLSGQVTVTAQASDNVGVTKVELYINNVLKSTDTTAPYSFAWDTASYSNGSHTLSIKMYDTANNIGTSSQASVTVSNSVVVPVVLNGDINKDGVVNINDVSILLGNWNKRNVGASKGDLNNDGIVNIFDMSLLLANWGKR